MGTTASIESFLAGAARLAVLGVGSELRSDDAAGLLVARRLRRVMRFNSRFLAVPGGSAPENFTGPIVRFLPSHIVIVDSADMGIEAGAFREIALDSIGGLSASTHSLPLRIVADYLRSRCRCEIAVMGIQAERLDFGGKPSPAVKAGARRLAAMLAAAARRIARRPLASARDS